MAQISRIQRIRAILRTSERLITATAIERILADAADEADTTHPCRWPDHCNSDIIIFGFVRNETEGRNAWRITEKKKRMRELRRK